MPKKCQKEKDADKEAFDDFMAAQDAMDAARRQQSDSCYDYEHNCDADRFVGLSGEGLQHAHELCERSRILCEINTADYRHERTRFSGAGRKYQKTQKALSNCEHKKKGGKK